MTLPFERKNSILKAKVFLRNLLDPKKTPKVPKYVRDEAYSVLKHYPQDHEIEALAKKCIKLLGEQI